MVEHRHRGDRAGFAIARRTHRERTKIMLAQKTSPEHFDNLTGTSTSIRRKVLLFGMSLAVTVAVLSSMLPARAKAATGSGPAIVNIVTFEAPADGLARLLQISKVNSQASLKEPGVTGFDVVQPKDQPNVVMLIESYRDETAYKAHRVTPHFLAFVKGVQEIGAKRTAHVATRFYPK
jgi:(4S)-4-hydroxy-5-phosphonooxypentane-2,3-dione isomerase